MLSAHNIPGEACEGSCCPANPTLCWRLFVTASSVLQCTVMGPVQTIPCRNWLRQTWQCRQHCCLCGSPDALLGIHVSGSPARLLSSLVYSGQPMPEVATPFLLSHVSRILLVVRSCARQPACSMLLPPAVLLCLRLPTLWGFRHMPAIRVVCRTHSVGHICGGQHQPVGRPADTAAAVRREACAVKCVLVSSKELPLYGVTVGGLPVVPPVQPGQNSRSHLSTQYFSLQKGRGPVSAYSLGCCGQTSYVQQALYVGNPWLHIQRWYVCCHVGSFIGRWPSYWK